MQFRDLQRQYEALKGDLDAAMQRVAAGAHYIMGPEVAELEADLASWTGTRHCISCANGTDALDIALKVWGIGPGDAVFVPDFTFFSSAEVVALEGATPVFVDVCESTFNIDCNDLERAIEEVIAQGELKPRVIIGVDLFGLPADWHKLREIARRYGLLLLEDGAQGFGGTIGQSRACSFGDISTTSFFPAKPLGCYGDGGAIFTDSDEWASLARSIRVHGKGAQKYDNVRVGLNSRLDTLQAAVLQVKFKAFRERELPAVQSIANVYDTVLEPLRKQGRAALPRIPAGYSSSWAQYTLRFTTETSRDAAQASLKAHGIPSMVYYPVPMSAQTAFATANAVLRPCPVAARLCKTVLSLPMGPYLTEAEAAQVASALTD